MKVFAVQVVKFFRLSEIILVKHQRAGNKIRWCSYRVVEPVAVVRGPFCCQQVWTPARRLFFDPADSSWVGPAWRDYRSFWCRQTVREACRAVA